MTAERLGNNDSLLLRSRFLAVVFLSSLSSFFLFLSLFRLFSEFSFFLFLPLFWLLSLTSRRLLGGEGVLRRNFS